MDKTKKIALLHGAGYVGRELIHLLNSHPEFSLAAVTSRSFSEKSVWEAHPNLYHQTSLHFSEPGSLDLFEFDGVFVAAEHGKSAQNLGRLIHSGYPGMIVDLSADFRLNTASLYKKWYRYEHPYPDLLHNFVYGLADVFTPYPVETRWIANPGCFATGISLALHPLARHLSPAQFIVTALTGASGSGATPKTTTHFPTRSGNVRAYKVLSHQHLPEILQTVGLSHEVSFTPVSGPWTRGIWGTIYVNSTQTSISANDVASWFMAEYETKSLVRLWPNQLPELINVVGTPYCDIGWIHKDQQVIIGFAIDNLLKGAASQAIQNMNLLFGFPDSLGLLPHTQISHSDL